ncbi:DUF2193 family protein [Archaeoglobus neptunius]|uniref:DUF2193 family protein n=1 Tax=Archaeoglobus neptunius TaxID=2798580 RepID=UPI001927DAC9|nr:DUF2193 family protein [Archaeoglobus neptunius]
MIREVLNEALEMQKTIVRTIERYRFEDFKIPHCENFVNLVKELKVKEWQSGEALDLYRMSVLNHYGILRKLTESIKPFESAFMEWMQTPVVVEILYDLDSSFREAAETFAKTINESDDLIALEAMRIANGFYGVTSAKDFAAIPGSTFSVLAKIAEKMDTDDYILAILASKSWGLNTSYIFGDTFLRVFRDTGNFLKAINAEKAQMQRMLLEPVKLQVDIMRTHGFSSFDPAEYMRLYREKMFDIVKMSIEDVHIANVVMLPTHVGDVGHHIGWQYYSICRDEINMELLRVHLAFLMRNLNADGMRSIFDISYYATGLSSLLIYRMLWDEGITAEMLARFFTERFYNHIMLRQFDRSVVNELHVNDLLDFAFRGQRLADRGWKIGGIEPDFRDYETSMLQHGELYAYPFCAITTKFATLMKFADMPCLLAPEPVSIAVLVNAVALNPEKPFAPVSLCKNCATAHVQPAKCLHCIATKIS